MSCSLIISAFPDATAVMSGWLFSPSKEDVSFVQKNFYRGTEVLRVGGIHLQEVGEQVETARSSGNIDPFLFVCDTLIREREGFGTNRARLLSLWQIFLQELGHTDKGKLVCHIVCEL